MDILFKAPSLEWAISLYWSQFNSQNSTKKASNNLAWVIVLPLDHRRQDILIVMPIEYLVKEGGIIFQRKTGTQMTEGSGC